MPYRWDRDKPLYQIGDDDIHKGDVFDPSDAVVNRFGEWLVEVDPKGSDGEDGSVESLEDKDYSELREMAMEADTDKINGRSSKDEIIAFFAE